MTAQSEYQHNPKYEAWLRRVYGRNQDALAERLREECPRRPRDSRSHRHGLYFHGHTRVNGGRLTCFSTLMALHLPPDFQLSYVQQAWVLATGGKLKYRDGVGGVVGPQEER